MKTLAGAGLVTLWLAGPALSVTLHLRIEPGSATVRDAATGQDVGTTTAGDVGDLTLDVSPTDHQLQLVRPPFEPRTIELQWNGTGWTWQSAGRPRVLSDATLFSLTRRIHLNVQPTGWMVYAEVSGDVRTGLEGTTLTVAGLPRVVRPVPQAGDEVTVPRAWSPPLLFVVAPRFLPQAVTIPRGALDTPEDHWPPVPLALSPLYGPFSYTAFDVGLGVLLTGAVAVWGWRIRPQQRARRQREEQDAALAAQLGHDVARRLVRSEGGRTYALMDLLGSGSAAEVFEATCVSNPHERVAIKLLYGADDASWTRFQQEVRLCQTVSHPAVVKVLDWGHDLSGVHPRPFLVMERVDGQSLRVSLQQSPWSTPDTVRGLGQLLRGLAAIHRQGATHRDVKPENVMLTGRDNLKIMDLGAAQDQSRSGAATAGTPRYMAPEHAEPRRVGPASDVYSAGLVGYEMLTGRLPWDDPAEITAWTLITQRRTIPPEPVGTYRNDVPQEVADLLMAMLSVDPMQRPDATTAADKLLSGT